MIKNVVFDFGQVLVHFEPEYMTRAYIKDEEDVKVLQEVVFDRVYWDPLDLGTITDEEVVEKICQRLPKRLHKSAEEIYYNWIYNIPEVDGMRQLIRYVKEKYGVCVFLLSNISKYFAEHSDEIPILEEFDGCVFSGVCGLVKPQREIFDHLCQRFNLKPDETVFIDDSEKNTAGANDFGIKTYLFKKDVENLRVWLDSVLG